MTDPFLLDVTRLFSRRFAPIDTGIDRVERGIFEASAEDSKNRYLIRFGRFYFILKFSGVQDVLNNPESARFAVFKQLFRLSEQRGYKSIQPKAITQFLHVGHISHGEGFWQKLKNSQIEICILIHDVIPLDYPETCRDDQLSKFLVNFKQWTRHADLIISPSEYTINQIKGHASQHPPLKVVPLCVPSINLPKAIHAQNAFVVVGTIEPRKNIMILLRAWEQLFEDKGDACPHLWIIGSRGWKNQQVFDFLDHSPLIGKVIFEFGALDDEQMFQRVSSAQAVLFPSIAEGFGLPFYEAILSVKPVIASRIPAFEEAITPDSQELLLSTDTISEWVSAIGSDEIAAPKLRRQPTPSWQAFISNIALNAKPNISK